MPEFDKSGWTVFLPCMCRCIEARIASITIRGQIKPIFMLELLDLKAGLTCIKWLNVIKSDKGGYSVKPNSDFAKLYRSAKGYVPKARYSKANQLLKHFVDCMFIVKYESAKGTNGADYLRVRTIKPAAPIITDGWFSDGTLRDKNWKPTGNELEIYRKKSGKELETQEAVKSHLYLASASNSIPLKDVTYKVEPYNHTDFIPDSNDEYRTILEEVNGARVYRGHQKPSETQEQYHERMILESLQN